MDFTKNISIVWPNHCTVSLFQSDGLHFGDATEANGQTSVQPRIIPGITGHFTLGISSATFIDRAMSVAGRGTCPRHT